MGTSNNRMFSSWLLGSCGQILSLSDLTLFSNLKFTFILYLVVCAFSLYRFPDHFILATEACIVPQTSKPPIVSLGDWSRGNQYSHSIIEVFELIYSNKCFFLVAKKHSPSKIGNKFRSKKLNRQRGGLLKFQASSFNIFIPPPLVILNELPLVSPFLSLLRVSKV